MPIMAANAQSDARGAAWLLASAAHKCIAEPQRASDCHDALNNTYRLLSAYRRNTMFGSRPLSGRVAEHDEPLSLVPSSERHFADIRDAMDAAFAAGFGGIKTEEAVEKIRSVLRAVAKPDQFGATAEDTEGTKRFFGELLKRLAMR